MKIIMIFDQALRANKLFAFLLEAGSVFLFQVFLRLWFMSCCGSVMCCCRGPPLRLQKQHVVVTQPGKIEQFSNHDISV
jgi:hypothetical protein